MGVKIKGIEFSYEGTRRLIFDEEGKVIEHRDYFNFCSVTFCNVPIIGVFLRLLYSKFVDWKCLNLCFFLTDLQLDLILVLK